MNGWIGVDFDGTLATYEHWTAPDDLGQPVMPMVRRVRHWLRTGKNVKIMTARAYHDGTPERMHDSTLAVAAIKEWCKKHLGQELEVTCVKDYGMIELYDDRAVTVEANTGRLLAPSSRGFAQAQPVEVKPYSKVFVELEDGTHEEVKRMDVSTRTSDGKTVVKLWTAYTKNQDKLPEGAEQLILRSASVSQ